MKKKDKKESSVYGQFLASWKYVAENKKYIYFSLILFLFFLSIAIFLPVPAELEAQLKIMIQKLVLATAGLNWFDLISYIFVNNLGVTIIAILFGTFFCIVPFFIAISNGYVLGYVIKATLEKLGMYDGLLSLWRILPHGIFELPAVMIGLGMGFKLGVSFFQSLNKNSLRFFLREAWKALKAIFYVILPLLVVAAIIEGVLIKLIG